MKYCVSSYSYSQLTGSGAKKEIELMELAASMGFDAIEFAEINPPEGTDKAEYAKSLKAEAERCSIDIAAYCIGANLLKGESEIERLKNEVLLVLFWYDFLNEVRNSAPKTFILYFLFIK